jgi:hypothetical protein
MRPENVTFRKNASPIEARSGEEAREMDIVEITYPDGHVSAFPADAVSPETGQRYCDMFPAQYGQFKKNDDADEHPAPRRKKRAE